MEEPAINARARRLGAWALGLGIAGFLTAIAGVGVLFALAALVCGAIALSELRPWRPHDGHGWALTGITFAVAALLAFPLLLATAVPRFITARRTQEQARCYANLQTIEAAKSTWANEHRGTNGMVLTLSDLGAAITALRCPKKGRYRANPLGSPPECSIAAHNLEPPAKHRLSR